MAEGLGNRGSISGRSWHFCYISGPHAASHPLVLGIEAGRGWGAVLITIIY